VEHEKNWVVGIHFQENTRLSDQRLGYNDERHMLLHDDANLHSMLVRSKAGVESAVLIV